MNWLGQTPSWSDDWYWRQKYEYECNYCGKELKDHETHIRNGSTYCGCCAWA